MIYEFDSFALDADKRELLCQGAPVAAEPRVFDVLLYLIENRERAVGHEELFEACWPNVAVSGGTLSRCLSRVRLAIGQPRSAAEPILTLHRKGYRFVGDVVEHPNEQDAEAADEAPAETAEAEREANEPLPEGRRYVTMLECWLGIASDAEETDPEVLYRSLRAFHEAAAAEGSRLDGVVATAEIDRLRINFGVSTGLERAAEAAAVAAGRLAELARAVGIEAHLGLASGIAVVGPPLTTGGGPMTFLINAAGPAELAAAAGPGEALLDARSALLVAPWFQVEQIGDAHRLGSRRGASAVTKQDGPFIGRYSESERLRQCWSQAKAGRSRAAFVIGDAGLGKSRLVSQFCADNGIEGEALLTVACSPHHQLTPFHPLLTLLRAHLGISERTPRLGQLVAVEGMLRALDLPQSDHLPIFASLLAGRPEPGPEPVLRMDPARKRNRTLEAIIRVILSLAADRKPLTLWIEDAQWADPSTRDTLKQLLSVAENVPLLVVTTAREVEDVAEIVTESTPRIVLKPFTKIETERFLAAHDIPVSWLDRIATQSDGVPLFLREFSRMATGEYAEADGAAPPETLRALLLARLDSLGSAREVCEWASCIGRVFERDLLSAASGLEDETIDAALEKLEGEKVMTAEPGSGGGTLRFSHHLMRDTAHEAMLAAVRQPRHAAIAATLAERFPEIAAAAPERLAHHYEAAAMGAEAAASWLAAGRTSAARSAEAEARGAAARAGASFDNPETTKALLEEIENLLAEN